MDDDQRRHAKLARDEQAHDRLTGAGSGFKDGAGDSLGLKAVGKRLDAGLLHLIAREDGRNKRARVFADVVLDRQTPATRALVVAPRKPDNEIPLVIHLDDTRAVIERRRLQSNCQILSDSV